MLVCIFYLAFLLAVNAMHNVTIDDSDPSIIYQPPDSWETSVYDVLDAGGRHHLTSDPDATASFTFTGVAIYFYSPLWTFQVTTQVALDDSPPVLLDLRDYTQPLDIDGPETVQSSVVWSQTGLVDTQHTLLVSVGPGQTIAVLDTLVYTAHGDDIPSLSSTSTSLPSSTLKPNPSTASEHASRKGLAVTLGVVCTVFGLLVMSGIWWLIRRHGDDHDFPRTINNDNNSPEMSNAAIPAYHSSRATHSHARDGRFRLEVAAVTNTRRTRPLSTSRHSTVTVTSSKLKNPLTTIPETFRETSVAQHTSRSPVRRETITSSLPHSNNDDECAEARTYPQPVKYVSVT